MRKLLVLAVALSIAGCKSPAPLAPGTLTSDAVTDTNKYRDFDKVYHFQITSEVQMNVTSELTPWLQKCDFFGCGRYALTFSDELKQRDGKWIIFDCDDVAEKIIDRDLVPKVESACKSIHAIATEFWRQNNDPNEFTDRDGRIWRRQ